MDGLLLDTIVVSVAFLANLYAGYLWIRRDDDALMWTAWVILMLSWVKI
jgi:hypothetical protein